MLSAVELVSSADPSLIPDSAGGDDMSFSENGRFVALRSGADNLVPGDNNGTDDIFVRDLVTGTTELVSVAIDGDSGNAHSFLPEFGFPEPVISADGTSVAFVSAASDLVSGRDDTGTSDMFVRDIAAGTTQLVSVNIDGDSGNGFSSKPAISADGSTVAFESWASDLVEGDFNNRQDVFAFLATEKQFDFLAERTGDLAEQGALNDGQAGALLAKLEAAAGQLERGNETPAIHQLGAFTNQVESFIDEDLESLLDDLLPMPWLLHR